MRHIISLQTHHATPMYPNDLPEMAMMRLIPGRFWPAHAYIMHTSLWTSHKTWSYIKSIKSTVLIWNCWSNACCQTREVEWNWGNKGLYLHTMQLWSSLCQFQLLRWASSQFLAGSEPTNSETATQTKFHGFSPCFFFRGFSPSIFHCHNLGPNFSAPTWSDRRSSSWHAATAPRVAQAPHPEVGPIMWLKQ